MVNLIKCTNSINILVDLAIPTSACEIFGKKCACNVVENNMQLQFTWFKIKNFLQVEL
jgi:hypothetical protein